MLKQYRNEIIIILIGCLFFLPLLGSVHLFDWDEIIFAESAREMLVSGKYALVQINYQRFWEKPPLFFWFQVCSMKLFGVNDFAARFPNVICGILSLLTIFRIGKKVVHEQFARLWVMVYLGSLLPFMYFKTGLIDPWFNLLIFRSVWNLYCLATVQQSSKWRYAIYTGFLLGLAILTKGPVALLIGGILFLGYLIIQKFKTPISFKQLCIIALVAFIICFAWFGVDLIQNGPFFLFHFIRYQFELFLHGDMEHEGGFLFHWWILLIGCFPASIFFIKHYMQPNRLDSSVPPFTKWMNLLFWITLILFSIVKTKLVHYSSLCWFPLTYIATQEIIGYNLMTDRLKWWVRLLICLIGLTIALPLIALPWIMTNYQPWVTSFGDVFLQANLKTPLHWQWADFLPGVLLLIAVLVVLFCKNTKLSITWLFMTMPIFGFLTLALFAPKVEEVLQGAPVRFFQSVKNQSGYFTSFAFKSFVPYYYGQVKTSDTTTRTINELLYGKIDKPVYFSAKNKDTSRLSDVTHLHLLKAENGFLFYERTPN